MIINKLKKMLKVQMEKGEALRKESHETIEKLREEFDSLVREFMNYKKSSKSYAPDLGGQKPPGIDKNLADPTLYHKRLEKDHDIKKRKNKESYDESDKMDVDRRNDNQ
jgi:hypothetical protein